MHEITHTHAHAHPHTHTYTCTPTHAPTRTPTHAPPHHTHTHTNTHKLSVALRGSDCVADVHNDEICVIEDSSESGEDFDKIEDVKSDG